MTGTPPDLLDAARKGDAEALELLLSEHQGRIYRFGLKMCGHPEDAQDVAQDTLFAAARTIRGFRADSSVTTWLFTIARSFCIKKRRRPASAPEVVSLDAEHATARSVASAGDDPERAFADRELGAALDSAISTLDGPQREVLLLRDVEGLSAQEVAQVTGLGLAAVKSRLHRARAALRQRLSSVLAPRGAAAAARQDGCPDVIALLSRHLEGDVDPRTCAEMERHVAACSACGPAVESLRQTLKMCAASPPVELPAAVKDSLRAAIRAVLAEQAAADRRRGE